MTTNSPKPAGEKQCSLGSTNVESGEIISLADIGVDKQAARKDKALGLLAAHNVDAVDLNSEAARRVLRKIDWRIMPMIFILYCIQLMDKNTLALGAIMGLEQDTHLTASNYSWLGSLVYFGYLGGEIPATFLMQRLPIGKYLAVMCMLWGLMVAMHAACKDFAGLVVVRFLLGCIEVCTAPAAIYITGSWYTKPEQVSRVAIWWTTSGWSSVFSGFLGWAINQAPRFNWQALFILYGGFTFLFGILLWFVLAASPTEASWLTEDEKVVALARVKDNKTGTEVWRFNRAQLKEAMLDIRLYIVFMILVSTGLPNGGLGVFGPQIIEGFGFDVNQSTLLTMAPGVGIVVGTGVGWLVSKYTNRTIAGVFVVLLSCVGVIMMFTIPAEHSAARYGGYILTLQFVVCIISVTTYITAGVSGTTKKLAFGAAYQIGYAVGNIIGPQTYLGSEAPNYYTAKYTMLAFLIFTAILVAAMGLIHWRWNQQRDRQDAIDAQNGTVHRRVENEEFADLTDFQMRSFRYPI